MKMVETLSLDGDAVVSWYFAARAGRLEGELADSTALLGLNVPFPGGDCVPVVDLNLHRLYYNSNKNDHSFVFLEL